ncbi:MAG: hypothetical protein Q7T21_11630 [Gallionella sp.]|nr:hypothetical protein [Gallionella sp.]
MKFSASDFPLVRWNILAICASLLFSALVLYSSGEYAEKTKQDRRNAQSQLNDARKRLTAAHDDQKNMAIYADEYGTLIERHIIGDDHRLDWMEGLEKIRQKNLAVDFRYSIAPQKIYTPQPAIDSGNFDLHYSEMKLQFDLLHEGQLLDFFTGLRSQIKGKYQLEGCTVKRANDEEGAAAAVAVNIRAECSGGWITLKNRNAPQ